MIGDHTYPPSISAMLAELGALVASVIVISHRRANIYCGAAGRTSRVTFAAFAPLGEKAQPHCWNHGERAYASDNNEASAICVGFCGRSVRRGM